MVHLLGICIIRSAVSSQLESKILLEPPLSKLMQECYLCNQQLLSHLVNLTLHMEQYLAKPNLKLATLAT